MTSVRIMLLLIMGVAASVAQTRLTGPERASLQRQVQAAKQAWNANRLDEAAADFQAVLRRLPDFAEGHMSLGMIRSAQLRYMEAIPELEEALRLNPALNDARAMLGLDYFQTGVLPKAMELLEKAVKEDPSNPEFKGWLGMVYVGARLYGPAIAELQVAVQAKPKTLLFPAYLARAYAGVAAQMREQLVEQAKGSPAAYLALAQAYSISGDWEESASEYQAAAAMDPKLAGVNAALGDVYAEMGKFSEAEKAYQKESEIDPDFPDKQFRMGMVLTELGRDKEALPHLQSAVSQNPMNGKALFYLGEVYFDLHQFSKAVAELEKALSRPLSPKLLRTAHYWLWMAYLKLGNSQDADEQLQIFKKLEAQEETISRAATTTGRPTSEMQRNR